MAGVTREREAYEAGRLAGFEEASDQLTEQVLHLHRPGCEHEQIPPCGDECQTYCEECWAPWPCPTAKLLGAA